MKYWFKPARLGKWVAVYYPSSLAGWIVTLALLAAAIKVFILIDATSHSGSDTLIRFTPWFVSLALIYDLLCFRRGLYPWWWRQRRD
jgi:hypothetical protein